MGGAIVLAGAAASVPVWRALFDRALRSGQLAAWVDRRPEKLRIRWREIRSPWPGWVEVRGLHLVGRTPRLRWELTADEASGALRPLGLLRRRLVWSGVRARGVELRAVRHAELAGGEPPRRPVVAEETPAVEDLAAGTPSAVTPATPSAPPVAAPARPPWSFEFQNLDVAEVREVWVDDRRFRGRASARGGFALRHRTLAEVFDSRLAAEDVSLRLGGNEVARGVSGEGEFEIDPWPYRGARLRAVLGRFDGWLALQGEVEPDEIVAWLFAGWPGLELESEPSHVDARISLAHGRYRPGTRIVVDNPAQTIRFLGFTARGDARLTANVEGRWGKRRLVSELALGRWRLGSPEQPETLIGEGLKLVARAEEPRIDAPAQASELALDLGRATLPDLRFVNELLPAAARVAVERGSATVGGTLRFLPGERQGEGAIRVRGSDLRLTAAGQALEGDLEADLRLSEPELAHAAFSVAGSTLALRNVATATSAGESVRNWWGELRLAKGRVELARPARLSALFDARLADTRPMIAFYEVRRDLPEWVERLLTVENVAAAGGFEWTKGRLRLDDTSVPLAHGELRAQLDLEREARQGRLLLVWRGLAVGVELAGGERNLRLRDARDWYQSPWLPTGPPEEKAAAQ